MVSGGSGGIIPCTGGPQYPRIQYPRFQLSAIGRGPEKIIWNVKEIYGSQI